MSLDQRLAMFASGNVVDIDKLGKEVYYLILHIFRTDYGQIILRLNKHWGANIYVWLPRNYNSHFPLELIPDINSGKIFFKIKYKGSYLKYVFLEFTAIK